MLFTTVTFICVLLFLVFVHELGHFLVARKVGIRVLEFSLGFPPKMFSTVFRGTEYMISWIPLGGYVKLHGQNIEDEDPNDPDNYAAKTGMQRFFVLLGGPAMNLITAFLLMSMFYFIGFERPAFIDQPAIIGEIESGSKAKELDIRKNDWITKVNGTEVETWEEVNNALGLLTDDDVTMTLQREEKTITVRFSRRVLYGEGGLGLSKKTEPIIGKVSENLPAYDAGVKEGDIIQSIDGTPINDWLEISPVIKAGEGKEILLVVRRQGRNTELFMTPVFSQEANKWIIGIANPMTYKSYSITESFVLGAERIFYLTGETFRFFVRLFEGKGKKEDIGGPLMIAKVVGEAAERGFGDLLRITAFISLQLAIFNLLPIPALDGGHIFFLAIEKIRGNALSAKIREKIQAVGISLLLLLMVYVFIQDGIRLFSWNN